MGLINMSFKAEVLRVLIASPSDVQSERDQIEKAIFNWNTVYAEDTQVVLLPTRWENVAPSYVGNDPQQILNENIVNKSDILIGVFWTKLGSPTANYPSGTLEEINQFIIQGKEVMVYFVDRQISIDAIDVDQIEKLKEFKKDYQGKGIYHKYDIPKVVEHLYTKVTEYKSKNGEELSKINELSIETDDSQELRPLESLILSGALTNQELLLLKFIRETNERFLGARWMAEETLVKIRNWEKEINIEQGIVEENYENILVNLNERGLLEVSETTSYGKPRKYVLPISIFDELRCLSNEVSKFIEIETFKFY